MDRLALDKLKNVMDEAKSVVKAKMGTDVERKIEEALSNKNWGASSTLLNELSQLTYDYEAYGVITRKIWEAMDAEGRQWRSVYKALSLLEHLIKNGTERVIENARDHMFKLRHLSGFSYHDGSVDRGNGVRDKAKQLVDMLNDNDLIRTEREKAGRLRNKYVGIGSGLGGGIGGGGYVGSSSSYSEERSGGGYSGGGGYSNSSGNSYSGGGYSAGGGYSGGGGNRDYGVGDSKKTNEKDKSYSTRTVEDDRDDESDESDSEEEVQPKRRVASSREKAAAKKKEETKSKSAVQPSPQEPSLLDADFFSPAPVAATANTFDPFASAPVGVAAVQPAQPQTASFAAFGNATPSPQQSFNTFGAAQPTQQAPFNAFGISGFAQDGTQQFATFPAAPAQQGLNALGQQANAAAPPGSAFNVQQQQQFGQYGGMKSGMAQSGQGGMDVQGATSSQSVFNPSGSQSRTDSAMKPQEKKSNDAWGAGSSLYDLNNLGSSSGTSSSGNHSGQHPHYQHQQSNVSCNSFSGLDTLAGMPSKPVMGAAGGMNQGMGGMSYGGGMGMGHSGMQQQAAFGQMGQGSMVMGSTQHRPMMGGVMGMQQPGMGMQQPGMGMQQLGMGMQQPGMGMQQPGMGMQQPGMGMQQPGMGMQPGVGGMTSQGGFGGMASTQQQRQQQAFHQFGNFS